MKISLNIRFSPISLEIPLGAKRITQWNRDGDHRKVFADYVSGPCGDVNTGEFFIQNGKKNVTVKRGDWIFDMEDGSYQVVRMQLATPEEAVKFAFEGALESMRDL